MPMIQVAHLKISYVCCADRITKGKQSNRINDEQDTKYTYDKSYIARRKYAEETYEVQGLNQETPSSNNAAASSSMSITIQNSQASNVV